MCKYTERFINCVVVDLMFVAYGFQKFRNVTKVSHRLSLPYSFFTFKTESQHTGDQPAVVGEFSSSQDPLSAQLRGVYICADHLLHSGRITPALRSGCNGALGRWNTNQPCDIRSLHWSPGVLKPASREIDWELPAIVLNI